MHSSPSVLVATAFICQFASGSNSAVGSLLNPLRLMTPSTPSSALAGTSRTSATIVSIRSDTASSPELPKYIRSSTRTE
jgi:hypothetical protein